MSSELLDALERTRAGYDEERHWHKYLIDAYTGGGGFQGAIKQPAAGFWGSAAHIYSQTSLLGTVPIPIDSYLDQYPREDAEKFRKRVESSVYYNYIAPLTDLKLSFILRKDFSVEDRPPALEDWHENVDGKGTSYDEIRPSIALRAAILGWCPVVVDMPPAPVGADGSLLEITRAGARELGLYPRAVPLFPANLTDYDTDETGEFVWAKIRTDHVIKPGPFDEAVEVTRYVIWYRDRFDSYEVLDTAAGKKITELAVGAPHPFGAVPVAICKHRPSPDDPIIGLPMHGQESKVARELFNNISELREQMRSQVFAVLVLALNNTEETGSKTIGASNALLLSPDSSNQHYYLSPDTGPASTYETRIEATIKDIYRTARVEFARPSGSAVSGVARRFEFAQTNRAISDFAGELARFEEWLDMLVGRGLGVSEEAVSKEKVTPAKDFAVEDLEQNIARALDIITLKVGKTAEKALKTRVLQQELSNLPEADWALIEAELDELRDEDELDANFDALSQEMFLGQAINGQADREESQKGPGSPPR